MVKRLLVCMALSVFVLCVWGENGPVLNSAAGETQAQKAEEAYRKAMEKRREVEPIEERLAITKGFLDEYPESDHTANALSAVFYYQGTVLGDKNGAIAYVRTIRSKIADPEITRAVDKEMLDFFGEADMVLEMLALAGKLASDDALNFNDHWTVIEHAIRTESWKLARDYCKKATPMATGEAFRSDYPDYEASDEEVAAAADNRVGMLLVKDGWARANLGEVEEALADFAKAGTLVRRSYLDVPEYDLDLYWGKTLMEKGKHQEAIERFATEALVVQNEEALAGLKEAYAALHGETGFDQYAAKLHRKIAKSIDDFELPDYKGNLHRLSRLKGDVTLVAFWFPT